METDPSLQVLAARRSLYDFLAYVYRTELDEPFLQRMKETRFLEQLNEQAYSFDLQELEPINSRLAEKLALEYARLFIGPGPHLPLYESVHNPKDPKKGRLWGDSTVDVKKMIEFYGLRFEGTDYHGIPDHISAEFEFMVRLVGREIEHRKRGEQEQAENCRRIQKEFFENHILVWVLGLCDEVISRAQVNFYEQIGVLTRDFIDAEGRFLLS